jgi:hypothetical protein
MDQTPVARCPRRDGDILEIDVLARQPDAVAGMELGSVSRSCAQIASRSINEQMAIHLNLSTLKPDGSVAE